MKYNKVVVRLKELMAHIEEMDHVLETLKLDLTLLLHEIEGSKPKQLKKSIKI